MPAQILCFFGYGLAMAVLIRLDAVPFADLLQLQAVDFKNDLWASAAAIVVAGLAGVALHFDIVPNWTAAWRRAQDMRRGES